MSDSELTVASRGIWIPNEVWENPGLSIQEKALLARIHSFEECFASNQYLADFLGLSVTRTKELITSLCRNGYLHRKEERKGRMTVKRVLSVDKAKYYGVDAHGPENRPTPAGKPSDGEPESRHHSYKELAKENSNTVLGTSADAPCSVCFGFGDNPEYFGEICEHCNGTGKEPTCNDGLQVQDVRNSRTTEKPKPKKPTKAQALFNLIRENPEQWPALNCVDDNLLMEWAKLRTRKGASSEQRALNTIEKTLQELRTVHGIAPDTALAAQCDAGWATVKVEYLVKNGRGMSYTGQKQSPYDDSSDFRDLVDVML